MTKQSEATPGPWYAHHGCVWRLPASDMYEYGGGVAGDSALASVFAGPSSWENKFPADANAALMAAAPDLRDAADMALNVLIGCAVPGDGVDDRKAILEAQSMLRAAITKATQGA